MSVHANWPTQPDAIRAGILATRTRLIAGEVSGPNGLLHEPLSGCLDAVVYRQNK